MFTQTDMQRQVNYFFFTTIESMQSEEHEQARNTHLVSYLNTAVVGKHSLKTMNTEEQSDASPLSLSWNH